MKRLLGVLAALCLIGTAQAQPVPYQFLVLYEVGGTSPKAMERSKVDRDGCERVAAAKTAEFLADGYRVKCEVRGPHDMIWKLWGLDPEQGK